jgi:hypothetical protein
MRTFGVGHDHGNSRTTDIVYCNGKEHMRTFASASADGSLKQLARMRRAEGNDSFAIDFQALRPGEYVLSYDGTERFVGELAVTQGQSVSTGRGDIHRYWSRRSLETLLVSAADVIPDAEFELLVVTGLPVETFNEETRKRVKDALNGRHHFVLNGRERSAYVKVGKVLMEGAGASLRHEIGDTDDIRGIIDIGGRTTDLYVRQGLQAVARQCKGMDLGVETAADKISVWFEDKYGFELSLQQRTRILNAYATGGRDYPTIKADGVLVPELELARWTRKAIADVGKEIAAFVSKIWRTGETGKVAADFADVEVVGGGAYYYMDAIRSILPRVTVPNEPEHANARGYGWFADQLVKQRVSMAS